MKDKYPVGGPSFGFSEHDDLVTGHVTFRTQEANVNENYQRHWLLFGK